MLSEPKFITRDPQPYAAIRIRATQPDVSRKAPPLVPEILDWVAANGEQAGPAFFNYTRMDGADMDSEIGAPTTRLLAGNDRVATGTRPGGRYVMATYTGDYSGLRGAHEALHAWLSKQGLQPRMDDGSRMTLLEIYETDPDDLPDPADWITHIAFKLPE